MSGSAKPLPPAVTEANKALIAAAPTLLDYALEAREVLREINEAYLDDEIHALPGPIKRRLAALIDTEEKTDGTF